MKNYFYQVEFEDGRVIRREKVSKKLAQGAHDTFVFEMLLLNVRRVSYGIMEKG